MNYDKIEIDVYTATGNELADRILRLIPSHPEILEMEDVFDLNKIDGFDCSDLQPSLFQAGWALSKARQTWHAEHPAATP